MPARFPTTWHIWLGLILVATALGQGPTQLPAADELDLFVLMHNSGKIERYQLDSGQHLGTVISGLPPANAILPAPDGCWLISTGKPGEVGNVLRFDPSQGGSLRAFIDIPEGYGGRVLRPTGMTWWDKRLLVASQIDGKVKCYDYPSGQWVGDVATASPGGMTQITVDEDWLFVTDYSGHSIGRVLLNSKFGAPLPVQPWANLNSESPWGVVTHSTGQLYCSTAGGKIFRANISQTDKPDITEWVKAGSGLSTPFSLTIGPDDLLYCASLGATVSVWPTQESAEKPVRVIAGPEVLGPASVAFAAQPTFDEFHAPNLDALAETADKLAYFENHIRPILHKRCLECHDENVQEAKLRLDSRPGWEQGGRSGNAIVPGKPESSLLIQAILHVDKDLKMPPGEKLPAEEIEYLTQWVLNGAIDPRRDQPKAEESTTDSWAEEFQQRLDWWSLKPPGNFDAPQIADDDWSLEPIDRFLLASLKAAGLKPSTPATPEVLARRLAQVLTGLPLSPELRAAYMTRHEVDPAGAYAWLVDQLMDSPHYGEHMARHWMDVVRYTDTYGYEWDNPAKGSHEYRDYLIRAFNADLPYDTFVREQLAGDLLPKPRINAQQGINESIIGPMFYHLGEHRHGSSLAFNGIHQEMMNNKVDAFSKTFLATTVACARCHDHKREAVSQKDYYALAAVFMTPRWVSRPADAPGKNATAIAQLTELRAQISQELARAWSTYKFPAEKLKAKLNELRAGEKPPKPNLTDVLYPLWKLTEVENESERAKIWNQLQAEYQAAKTQRAKQNESTTWLTNFADYELPEGWVMEGEGIESGWTTDGMPLISLEGETAVSQLLPQGLHSHALSSKLPGVLRMPPQHSVPGKFTSLLIAGGQYSGSLVLDENSFQNETVTFFNESTPAWKTYADAALKNGVMRVTIDFATSSLNANFPPRTGLAAGLPPKDMGFDKRSWMSICGIATHDTPTPPQNTLEPFDDLLALGSWTRQRSDDPGSWTPQRSEDSQPALNEEPNAGASGYGDDLNAGASGYEVNEYEEAVGLWFQRAVERWCQGHTKPGDVELLNFLLKHDLLPNTKTLTADLGRLIDQYREVENRIEFPRTVNSMDERSVAKAGVYFNVRGNVDAMGELVMPDGLSMFAGRNTIAQQPGSGRLELAESILAPDHPLTSRVYVNRVWQWIFGEGLVRTPDDFGRLGERPSHPELLDWLARNFVASGWSTKQLVKILVLSQAFRQSGQVDNQALQVDPANRLLHHFATRRMQAEEIRDALLSVSGKLDRRLYGRPINPPRAVEDETKRLFSGPVDGHGRRSIYLTMSIMAPPKFLTTFDLPDLKLPSGKRNVTSVPGQALQLLNDPLVLELSTAWADAVLASQAAGSSAANSSERLDQMFVAAYARLPGIEERKLWLDYISELGSEGDVANDRQAWTQVAHAMFNTKEFLCYR